MKKGIRIAFFSLLFLAGVGMITWYFIMRRQIPQHAQCIPKNVIAVLTLNLRELALDRASGGHLFPEMADKKLHKEIERFTKAVEKNDGSGLAATADVLGFFYRDGEAAFFGVSASLKDSAKFGKMLREQLAKDFSIRPFLLQGSTIIQFDTSSAIVGWNNDIALFLYPFGNHSVAETAEQCAKLLKQSQDQSVLANENFCEHELSSFDAGIWMQPKELLALTGGSALQRVMYDNIKYISLAMDFQDGELIIRKIITEEKLSTDVLHNSSLLLTCDPKHVLGFYHAHFNFHDDSLINDFVDVPPLNLLTQSDERSSMLAKSLDGNFTLLVHDTFSFDMDYITYDYDADFNRVPMKGKKRVRQRGLTANFGLKDPSAAQKLITGWMKEDSIPLNGNTWLLDKQNGAPHYMMLTGNVLTVSNSKQSDGKPRAVPGAWEGLDVFLPVGNIILTESYESLAFLFPQIDGSESLLRENFENLLISQPLVVGNERSSQIRLTMHNKKVNALVQMEELFRKIAFGNN